MIILPERHRDTLSRAIAQAIISATKGRDSLSARFSNDVRRQYEQMIEDFTQLLNRVQIK